MSGPPFPEDDNPERDLPRKRFKLSPGLGDGEHYTVADSYEELRDVIEDWAASDPPAGEVVTVEILEMTDAEIEALPDL